MPASKPQFANLWLPVPKRQSFTYEIPPSWQQVPQPGQLVWAPLGRRKIIGMVGSLDSKLPPGLKNCKELLENLPEDYRLSSPLFKLAEWSQKHYLAAHGDVLRTFFPNLLLKGKFDSGKKVRIKSPNLNFQKTENLILNIEQKKIVTEVQSHLGNFHPVLLQGITGSGKTEVYLQACEKVLAQNGGALILVPEISLTPQIVGRFLARFGDVVGTYHSGMTEAQRLWTWREVTAGRQKIVVGTRSAVALPVKNMSLIVVDEEHDSSYKQEERFRYHARDLAVVRAKIEQVPILLGSATPSGESLENVHNKKYHHFTLSQRAVPKGGLPKIYPVDLKKNKPHPDTFLTPILEQKMTETLERGEQVLLFLNRRGYAPFVLCEACGEVVKCPNCDISLTFHQKPSQLKCHYCEYQTPILAQCPHCEALQLSPVGTGTERLEKSFSEKFPKVSIARLDRDIAQSAQKTEELLSQFEQGKIDVLIGTQLITKGHDFKRLTLVGILLADVTLNLPDFRAPERVFQIVTQVAGRAGRHDLPGEVVLQTFRPEHYAITSALQQDVGLFWQQERSARQAVGYPPFGRIILFKLSGIKNHVVKKCTLQLTMELKTLLAKHSSVKILGPSPSVLEKIRGKFRWNILLSSPKFEALRRVLEAHLNDLETHLSAGVKLSIDVDPVGIF